MMMPSSVVSVTSIGKQVVNRLDGTLSSVGHNYFPFANGVILLVVLLLAWRVWRFTITPMFYPNDPKELPYWIPIPGHLIGFFNNSDTLLTSARHYFCNTKEPYAISVAGLTTYVVTEASHVGEIYRNADTLSYDEFVQAMMRILGNSEPSVKAMFTPLPKDKKGFPNPHGKPLGILFREMHIHQLYPGENLTSLETRFQEFFDVHLNLDKMAETCSYAIRKTSQSIVLPLTQWCSDYFVRGGQSAYFGPKLAEIDPSLTDAFIVFDELSYQVIYQYPPFLARKMLSARDRVLRGLKEYLELDHDHRSEEVWFVKAMEAEMRAIGMNQEDMAIATMTIYWAINTNTRKAGFWMLAYLLETPSLMDEVREETALAIREDGTVDFDYLHHSAKRFDASWNEMLRLASFGASVRLITTDTVVGGKLLRKGNRLIIPYRELHMDSSVYGQSVHQFQPQRFLVNPKLSQRNNFRPFGGGSTMCPGRYIAKRAVLLFISMLLRRFDLKRVGESKSLAADPTRPAPGLMSARFGQELIVELMPRIANVPS
ncbi:putative cytochrome P450 oxidoreductase [Nemania serpens]|nr:putative cytochrome P450 oxidoreductase [Nemania serpens]